MNCGIKPRILPLLLFIMFPKFGFSRTLGRPECTKRQICMSCNEQIMQDGRLPTPSPLLPLGPGEFTFLVISRCTRLFHFSLLGMSRKLIVGIIGNACMHILEHEASTRILRTSSILSKITNQDGGRSWKKNVDRDQTICFTRKKKFL